MLVISFVVIIAAAVVIIATPAMVVIAAAMVITAPPDATIRTIVKGAIMLILVGLRGERLDRRRRPWRALIKLCGSKNLSFVQSNAADLIVGAI